MRLLAGLLCVAVAVLHAQPARTANDRVYTEAQATRGRALYSEKCANCHGESLQGRSAPMLTGNAFLTVWGPQPLSELAAKIRNTMPATNPGTLKPSETADLVAYILQTGKFPAGSTELSADAAALKSIVVSGASASTASAPMFPPAGNLNQVMRGILFPTSNTIFNVQLHDPAKPTPKPAVTNTPGGDPSFSWTDWGSGIYTGWQVIDYAAVAIAESAPLLLTPGRRCENGKPVPVDRPDWIKFTQELAEAGRAAYKASQSRSQEAVSDSTTQLADACFHCHSVYRDKRGGRPGDPAASAGRCTPGN
jgi:mono/diheme cytochrome c family protein